MAAAVVTGGAGKGLPCKRMNSVHGNNLTNERLCGKAFFDKFSNGEMRGNDQ
jgi:hypothetical protein